MSGSTVQPEERPEQVADVGILFVHGVGSQQRAETLAQYAVPLQAWINARSALLGGSGVVVTEDVQQPFPHEPARARWAVGMPGLPAARWLLAEGYWADSFPLPGAVDVLRWAGSFSKRAVKRVGAHMLHPAVALHAFVAQVVGFIFGVVERFASEAPPLAFVALWLFILYFVIGSVLTLVVSSAAVLVYDVILFLLAVLVVVCSWLLAVALIPVRQIPPFRYVATWIVANAGDAYAFLKQPPDAAAMEKPIRDAITWVSERSRHLVIVAHSQGAALAVEILTDDPAPQVDWLVTLGGAVGLLNGLQPEPVKAWCCRRHHTRWTNIWAGWDPVSAGPVVDRGETAEDRWLEIYRQNRVAASLRQASDMLFGGSAPRPADPTSLAETMIGIPFWLVSQGVLQFFPKSWVAPLPARPEAKGPAEVAVHNRASLIIDHITYAANHEQVMARIAAIAAEVGGRGGIWTDPREPEGQNKAEKRHVTAVRLLGASRLVNVLTTALVVAALVKYGMVTPLFSWMGKTRALLNPLAWINRLPSWSSNEFLLILLRIARIFEIIVLEIVMILEIILLPAIIFTVSHGLTAVAWRRWQIPRPGTASLRAVVPAVVFAVLVAVSIAGSVLAAWALRDDWALITLLVESYIVAWSFFGFRPAATDERLPPVETVGSI